MYDDRFSRFDSEDDIREKRIRGNIEGPLIFLTLAVVYMSGSFFPTSRFQETHLLFSL